jgi:hypothetical protein
LVVSTTPTLTCLTRAGPKCVSTVSPGFIIAPLDCIIALLDSGRDYHYLLGDLCTFWLGVCAQRSSHRSRCRQHVGALLRSRTRCRLL